MLWCARCCSWMSHLATIALWIDFSWNSTGFSNYYFMIIMPMWKHLNYANKIQKLLLCSKHGNQITVSIYTITVNYTMAKGASARRITKSTICCSQTFNLYILLSIHFLKASMCAGKYLFMLSAANSVVPSAGMTSWLYMALTIYIYIYI